MRTGRRCELHRAHQTIFDRRVGSRTHASTFLLTDCSIGRAIVDLSGEEPSKASLLKVIGNVLIMTTLETVAELNVFSEKTGLGVSNMRNLIEILFPSSPHLIYWDKMAGGDYYQKEVYRTPRFPVTTSYVLTFSSSLWSKHIMHKTWHHTYLSLPERIIRH